MVAVMIIMGIADTSLVIAAFVSCISCLNVFVILPGVAMVNYNFIAFIPVEIAISWG